MHQKKKKDRTKRDKCSKSEDQNRVGCVSVCERLVSDEAALEIVVALFFILFLVLINSRNKFFFCYLSWIWRPLKFGCV